MKTYLVLLAFVCSLLSQTSIIAGVTSDLGWSVKENSLIVEPRFQGEKILLMSGLENEISKVGYEWEKDKIKKEVKERVNGVCKIFGYNKVKKYQIIPLKKRARVASPLFYDHSQKWGAYLTNSEPSEHTVYGDWRATKSYTTSMDDYVIDTNTTIYYVVVLDWIYCE